MASNKTTIGNRALAKLGEPRVSNFDSTNTLPARTINEMYVPVRDAMLQSYPWNFAIKLVQLAKDPTAPVWEYSNRFTLPADCLQVVAIKNDPDYRVRAGYIHTDAAAPLYIRYIRRVESEGDFSPIFAEAFSSRLAYESAEVITQSNTKKEAAWRDFQDVIARAFATDAIEDPPVPLPEDEWLNARA